MDPMPPPPPSPGYPAALANPPGAVGSLVCGIISLVMCFMFPPVALVLGIIAVVLAGKAKKEVNAQPGRWNPGGVRTGGFVCGLIGLVLGALGTLWFIFVGGFLLSHKDEIEKMIEEQRDLQRQIGPAVPGR